MRDASKDPPRNDEDAPCRIAEGTALPYSPEGASASPGARGLRPASPALRLSLPGPAQQAPQSPVPTFPRECGAGQGGDNRLNRQTHGAWIEICICRAGHGDERHEHDEADPGPHLRETSDRHPGLSGDSVSNAGPRMGAGICTGHGSCENDPGPLGRRRWKPHGESASGPGDARGLQRPDARGGGRGRAELRERGGSRRPATRRTARNRPAGQVEWGCSTKRAN